MLRQEFTKGFVMDAGISKLVFIIRWVIGFLIILAVASLLAICLYVLLRIFIFRGRQRIAQRFYYRSTHRKDGKRYPPYTTGICDHCGILGGKIYYTPEGPRLCPDCYEEFWPLYEAHKKEGADHPLNFSLDYAPENKPPEESIRPR
jgi:hypothetical protein